MALEKTSQKNEGFQERGFTFAEVFAEREGYWLWLLLNSLRDGIGIMDEHFRLLDCNQGFVKTLGYSKDEMIGMYAWDFDVTVNEEVLLERFPDRSVVAERFETRHRCKDGNLIEVEVSLTGTQVAGQNLVIFVSRDITKRKRERTALLKTQFAMDNARDNCAWLDSQARFVYANETACQALGYSREEMLQKNLFDVAPDLTLEHFTAMKLELEQNGSMLYETVHRKKEGQVYPVEVSCNLFGEGNDYLVCIFVRDISERKAAEEILQQNNEILEQWVEERNDQLQQEIKRRWESEKARNESEATFRALAEFALDVIIRFDREYRHLYVNPAIRDFAGVAPEELIGKRIDEVENLKPIAPHLKAVLDTVFDSGQPMQDEFMMPNGIWVESVLSPELDEDGRVRAVITTSRDITPRKKAEQDLKLYSELQTLLMGFASSFINLPLSEVEGAIDDALAKLGTFVNADRAYVFHYDFIGQLCENKHEWCSENTPSRMANLELPLEEIDFLVKRHSRGEIIQVSDIENLKKGSDTYQLLKGFGVRSLVIVPMMSGAECSGFVGFESVDQAHYYSEKEGQLLSVFAHMLFNIKKRQEADTSLSQQHKFQEIIADIAAEFVGATSDNIGQKLTATLERVGLFFGIDRLVFFLSTAESVGSASILEWCDEGIASRTGQSEMPPLILSLPGKHPIGRRQIFHFPEVEKMPLKLARWQASLEFLGVKSALYLSSHTDKKIYGIIGVEMLRQYKKLTENQINGLCVIAQIFAYAIANIEARQLLVEAKDMLEQRVQERTGELEAEVMAREKAMEKLAEAQSSLLDASRCAGMAEVASNVLHNVGNVLNSVNVSSTLLLEQLEQSRLGNVMKVAQMLSAQGDGVADFLANDQRGRKIPAYLNSLAGALQDERGRMLSEAQSLNTRIGHVKEIITMQQSYGTVYGFSESIDLEQLIEDSVKIVSSALSREKVAVIRDYEDIPLILTDKHRVLQILLNLIKNANLACKEAEGDEHSILLRLFRHGDDVVRVQVSDTGVGIRQENLSKIFQHGFTTRESGHGFGLHSGALAAKQLGGSLTAQSDGPGRGATFTLELPLNCGE